MATLSVPSLDRALTMLETIIGSRRGLTLDEISKKLALPRSSTHCLLLTLERRGYLVRQRQTHRYMIGLRLAGLANAALVSFDWREKASPFLNQLMQETRLTVHMATLERGEAVVVEKIEPPGLLRLATWKGKRMDIHCTGVGKALLAYQPEQELDFVIKDHGLPRHNENTLTSPNSLRKDLAGVRNRGYAIDDEEDEVGLRCVAAPVFDYSGKAVAAISVSGTTAQMTEETIPFYGKNVIRTASYISRAMAP